MVGSRESGVAVVVVVAGVGGGDDDAGFGCKGWSVDGGVVVAIGVW